MKSKLFTGIALLLALILALIPAAALATNDDAPPDIIDGTEDAPDDIVSDNASPSTGDNTNLLVYGGIAVIAIIAAGSFAVINKKKVSGN